MKELPKAYNPAEVEEKIYKMWEKEGYFTPKIDPKKKPFVIVIPPPNITGTLHMGHALNNTIQDVLIRWHRMIGEPTLWLPGTDHAGIATQNVVEKELVKEGKTRHDVGREKLIKLIWEWKEKYGNLIIDQLKKLGCSCDWSRIRFTMDEGYSKAVLETFIHFYKKGYLYRGERVINWCPRCMTALSDIELEYVSEKSFLWYIKYPLVQSSGPKAQGYITVATTRPETMLGDTAVAVNPGDKRYKNLIGKKAILPIVNREIPIIADSLVDPKFGTGAVKVTPAHDPVDFEISERHKLPKIVVIASDGTMTKEVPSQYFKMDRHECREAVVDHLKQRGLLQKIKDYTHNIAHCYRCDTVVEPLLSLQWFVKMDNLAKPAIKVVKENKIKFIPKRWEKVYLNWIENLKDWCISRQIWWGHRIPVWYCRETKNVDCKAKNGVIVSLEPPKKCPYCSSIKLVQDPDVLDTWFSSALWPHATLGWPEKTKDIGYFYPTTVLSTARDIIYLWVARMIMTGLEFMNKIPFSEVYIHATVLTKQGKRMSKSLGTGVDPINLIEKYGADATRFGLIWQVAQTQDMRFSEEAIVSAQRFANKIWNASRFVISNLDLERVKGLDDRKLKLTVEDKRILSDCKKLVNKTTHYFTKYDFHHAAEGIYHFFWHIYCDIYIENSKKRLYEAKNKDDGLTAQWVLYKILTDSLKLLHPLMPFVTEEIWQKLGEKKPLIIQEWPKL